MCQDFINGANTEIIISEIYVVSSDLIFFSNGHLTIKKYTNFSLYAYLGEISQPHIVHYRPIRSGHIWKIVDVFPRPPVLEYSISRSVKASVTSCFQ